MPLGPLNNMRLPEKFSFYPHFLLKNKLVVIIQGWLQKKELQKGGGQHMLILL